VPISRSPNFADERRVLLESTVVHAARFSPYYRNQLWAKRLLSGQKITFLDLPITPKFDLKARTKDFYCLEVPSSEGKIIEKFTSGSTGEPLRILKTQRHFKINKQENLRLSKGWGFEQQLNSIGMDYPDSTHAERSVVEKKRSSGGTHSIIYSFVSTDIVNLLMRTRASCFYGRGSVVLPVLQNAPNLEFLRLIATVSELFPDELRTFVDSLPNCRHCDFYGAVETGLIACSCSVCGEYHLGDRHLIVEVLGENDKPVGPGGLGRVVLTILCNLAMPLLRYDLGDYAIMSTNPNCSRSPVAISRVVGRERNLFKLPDGAKVIPNVTPEDIIELGIQRYKLVQISSTEVEFRYIPITPETTISDSQAQYLIDRNLSKAFRAIPVKVTDLPRAPGGKYLMHECLI
jgi:phenylacetate-CoA ligase